MIRSSLVALSVLACAAGPAAAQDRSGPWLGLMTWEGGVVGREARAAVRVADGLETGIIIVWSAPQPDGGVYMRGRMRVDCATRQASVMEAISMTLDGQALTRETRDEPNWGDGPPGTPVAALIATLCDDAPVADGPVHADAAAFVEAVRQTPPAS